MERDISALRFLALRNALMDSIKYHICSTQSTTLCEQDSVPWTFPFVKPSWALEDIMLSRAALRSARAPGPAAQAVGRTAKVFIVDARLNWHYQRESDG